MLMHSFFKGVFMKTSDREKKKDFNPKYFHLDLGQYNNR